MKNKLWFIGLLTILLVSIPLVNGLTTRFNPWTNQFQWSGFEPSAEADLNMSGKQILEVSNITGVPGSPLQIGHAGSTSHGLASNNDLFLSGQLEVDGVARFDNTSIMLDALRLNNNVQLRLGNVSNALLSWNAVQAVDTILFSLDNTAKSLIFTTKSNDGKDHDILAQDNPTGYFFSSTDPDLDNTQWGSLTHNTEDFVLDVGNVSSQILSQNNFTSHNTLLAEADVVQGDPNNIELFKQYANGTAIIFESVDPALPIELLTFNSTGGRGKCFMNDTWDWQCIEI